MIASIPPCHTASGLTISCSVWVLAVSLACPSGPVGRLYECLLGGAGALTVAPWLVRSVTTNFSDAALVPINYAINVHYIIQVI